MQMLEQGLRHYAAAGITTAQDCASFGDSWQLLRAMAQLGRLPIDVIAWPVYKDANDTLLQDIARQRQARGRFRLGGIKLTVDGSIQGYTAFLSRPYFMQPGASGSVLDKCDAKAAEQLFVSAGGTPAAGAGAAKSKSSHRGYASMTQSQVEHWLRTCDRHGIQMQVHTNGDGATDMLVKAVAKVRGMQPRPDLRTTLIHAQTMRNDQLDFSARHGLTVSFFPIHVYFWGDRHRDRFLGSVRAARINPARSALDRKIRITLHHDAPIAGIDMLKVAWTAIVRQTTSGQDLGPQERITPFEALRAITADAAWQNFEEDRKGTLEVGKLADLVVLSADPLAVDPRLIQDIQVQQTLKEGKVVFQRT